MSWSRQPCFFPEATRPGSPMAMAPPATLMSATGQQAHFLLTIDQTIRSELKFLEHWRPKFGTNCKSPVFEGQRMFLVGGRSIQDIYMERPTLGIQAVHTPSPHPPKAGMTTYKLALFCSKFRAKKPESRGANI